MKNKRYFRLIVVLFATILFGCKDDVAIGPDVVSDMTAYAGDLRAKVEFQAPAASVSGKVFFGSGKFTEFTIVDNAAKQSVIAEGLSEGEQLIRVVTYDANGEKSDPKGVKVTVYGEKYRKTLLDRVMINQSSISGSAIDLTFGNALYSEEGVKVVFINTSGKKDSVTMKSSENTVRINDIDLSEDYGYYTIYKPEPTAIDVFLTDIVDAKVVAAMNFEKTKWKVIAQSSQDASSTANYIIDDDIKTLWRSENSAQGPHSITVDMLSEKLCTGFYFVQSQVNEPKGLAMNIRLEVSTDNENWEISSENLLKATLYRQRFMLRKPAMARYFKITILDGYNNATSSQMAEIDLFNEVNMSGENGADLILVNAKKPFIGDGSDRASNVGVGRFQQVKEWTHENSNISFDNGAFVVWCAPAWGIPDITNGKIYQTVTLYPGSYTLRIDTGHTTDAKCVDMYGVAASGITLPDYVSLREAPTTLGFNDLVANVQKVNDIVFSVTKEGPITIGVVYNMHNNNAYPWSDMMINSFELFPN